MALKRIGRIRDEEAEYHHNETSKQTVRISHQIGGKLSLESAHHRLHHSRALGANFTAKVYR